MGECGQLKHTQYALSTKMECDHLYGWIEKNDHIHTNLTKNGDPRNIAGNAEEEDITLVSQATTECEV